MVSGVCVCVGAAVAVTGGLQLPQNLLPDAAAATAIIGGGALGFVRQVAQSARLVVGGAENCAFGVGARGV